MGFDGKALVTTSVSIHMELSQLKLLVRSNGGEVADVGWESFGSYKKAFVEVYYEASDSIPFIAEFESADNVVVDTEWDTEKNGVIYEVTVSER